MFTGSGVLDVLASWVTSFFDAENNASLAGPLIAILSEVSEFFTVTIGGGYGDGPTVSHDIRGWEEEEEW